MYEARQNKEKVSRRIDNNIGRDRCSITWKDKQCSLQLYKLKKRNFTETAQKAYNEFNRNKGTYKGNIAHKIGDSKIYFGLSDSNGHSEEQILDDLFGEPKIAGNGKKVTEKQDILKSKGAAKRQDIYTILIPCPLGGKEYDGFDCNSLLKIGLTDDSTVYYTYD